jgi:putative membrane protein
MKFLAQIVISAIAVIISALILPGVEVKGPVEAIIVAAVLAFLNTIVKPVLVLLTLPITIFTLGFFLLIINALITLLAAKLVPGFTVESFWSALIFSLVLTIVTYIFNSLGNKAEE